MSLVTRTAVPGIRWDAIGAPSRTEGGDLQALRGQNRVSVLKVLHGFPDGASMSEIHDNTTLSRPTIKLALADLVETRLVVEGEIGSSTTRGGRPGRRYRVNREIAVVMGAVIGLEHIDVAAADIYGTIIGRTSQPRASARKPREQIIGAVHDLLKTHSLQSANVRVLTIGVIGIVEPNGRIHRDGDFAEISEKGYFQPVEDTFSCDVLIDNDANLAAAAEFANLGRPEICDMIGLHADVAIGCGLILDSRLHRGFAGAAGELGFQQSLGWRDSHEGLQNDAGNHNMSVAQLFRAAGVGTDWARLSVGRFAAAVAPGVLALVVALNPQVIVIGGAICDAQEAFRKPLQEFVNQRAPAPPDILFSGLGSDCILLGAIGSSVGALWEELRSHAYRESSPV